MTNSFVVDLLFALVEYVRHLVSESTICLALARIFLWLRARFYQSFCFRTIQKVYRFVRRLCYDSMIGRLLVQHPQEEHIYDNSLIQRLFDGFFTRVTAVLRKVFSLLTLGTYDSVVISLGRRLYRRLHWLDFEFICGCVVLCMLVFPGAYWHNVYALIVGLLLVALLAIKAAVENRPMLRLCMVGLPFILFVFATVVGIGIAENRGESIRVFCFFLEAFLLCIVMIGTLNEERKLKKLLGFVYAGVVIAGIWAVCQRIIGVEASATLTDLVTNSGMPGRVYSFYENPNNYAEIIVLLLPVAFAYCTMINNINHRLVSLLGLIFPVAALLMTYSRSCWVSFALTVAAFAFFYKKRALPALILLGVLAIPLLPASIFNRILTIGSTQDSSNMYRIYIWDSVMGMIRDHGLIGLGMGPDNFRPVYQQYCHTIAMSAPHSHMLYLELWIEMGILGIGSYLAYYLATIRNAVVHMASASKPVRMVLIAGVSSLIGIAFVSAAEYIWFYPRVLLCFFLLTGIIAACMNLSKSTNSKV